MSGASSSASTTERVRAGDALVGTFLNLGSPLAAEVCALAGFDFVVVDLEHGAGTESELIPTLQALGGRRPAAALVFDCVATRLRLGRAFDDELGACAQLLKPARFVGCNTYGQIARAEGQFGGFHNCTAVVCVLPE